MVERGTLDHAADPENPIESIRLRESPGDCLTVADQLPDLHLDVEGRAAEKWRALWVPNLTEPHRTSPNLTEPHRTSPNLTEPHRTSPNLAEVCAPAADESHPKAPTHPKPPKNTPNFKPTNLPADDVRC
jgi:hypothetical protein